MSREELELKLRLLYQHSMNGDKESYEVFLELCSALIKRYLLRLGGRYVDTQSMEDLLQEVLITLHEKKHTYQRERPFLPWLYSIARHRYIDFYRSKKRQPGTVTFDPEFEKNYQTQLHEPLHDVEEIMSFLTPKQKEMLTLVKVEGASYQEAAKTLSMSVSGVKVGIHRILKSLKGKVNHED
jgi:RNA polymerase sigma-70 factor (ECF subfamily)